MKNLFALVVKNQSLIYKVFLFIVATAFVLYLLPKSGQCKYSFHKGKPWQYENLYAPFTFTIKKNEETLKAEREKIRQNAIPYFDLDPEIHSQDVQQFKQQLENRYSLSLYTTSNGTVLRIGEALLNDVYQKGVIEEEHSYSDQHLVYLNLDNDLQELKYGQFFKKEKLNKKVRETVATHKADDIQALLYNTLHDALIPNVFIDSGLTEAAINSEINLINPNKGVIERGGRIIAKGEIVEGDKYQILESLKIEYESQIWGKSNY